MARNDLPSWVPAAWEAEQCERIRRINEMEERERVEIPVRDYVRQIPERVPSIREASQARAAAGPASD
jgi:hypothetical protein